MKKHPRLILSLIMEDKRMIKRSKFSTYKYLGDPLNIIRIFNSKRVDEISLISCDKYDKNHSIDFEYLKLIAGEAFCPLTYSGGIRSLKDAEMIFSIGFEKIGLRNVLHTNPEIIKQISEKYGSQSVVIFIDYKHLENNEVEIYTSNNSFFKYKKRSSILDLIKKSESYGAGEIVLQCINREGQQNGLDLDLIKEISTSTQLPIISSCGMKNLTDARNAFRVGADGVMASKFFSLYGKCDGVLLTYPTYEEIELLK